MLSTFFRNPFRSEQKKENFVDDLFQQILALPSLQALSKLEWQIVGELIPRIYTPTEKNPTPELTADTFRQELALYKQENPSIQFKAIHATQVITYIDCWCKTTNSIVTKSLEIIEACICVSQKSVAADFLIPVTIALLPSEKLVEMQKQLATALFFVQPNQTGYCLTNLYAAVCAKIENQPLNEEDKKNEPLVKEAAKEVRRRNEIRSLIKICSECLVFFGTTVKETLQKEEIEAYQYYFIDQENINDLKNNTQRSLDDTCLKIFSDLNATKFIVLKRKELVDLLTQHMATFDLFHTLKRYELRNVFLASLSKFIDEFGNTINSIDALREVIEKTGQKEGQENALRKFITEAKQTTSIDKINDEFIIQSEKKISLNILRGFITESKQKISIDTLREFITKFELYQSNAQNQISLLVLKILKNAGTLLFLEKIKELLPVEVEEIKSEKYSITISIFSRRNKKNDNEEKELNKIELKESKPTTAITSDQSNMAITKK